MPRLFTPEYRADVVAVARKGEAPMRQVAKISVLAPSEFGISAPSPCAGRVVLLNVRPRGQIRIVVRGAVAKGPRGFHSILPKLLPKGCVGTRL